MWPVGEVVDEFGTVMEQYQVYEAPLARLVAPLDSRPEKQRGRQLPYIVCESIQPCPRLVDVDEWLEVASLCRSLWHQ